MFNILVVDDDKHIIELVKYNLAKMGWTVDAAYDGQDAIDRAVLGKPDLIILDIMLPERDGLDVCRILKADKVTSDIPIIMLSAKAEEFDKVLGLELGADDYIVKPFSPRELTARIKARLRKKNHDQAGKTPEEIKMGYIAVYPEKYEVLINGVKKDFPLKEFELLRLFITNPGKVFSREVLLERIWDYDYYYDTRTVDVHIRHLRKKIEEDPNNPEYIETVRGIGYRFKDPKAV
ncbi:MAG: DNA-binding response regulator [Firmicutes bacterium HGW-Firmicutes-14]|jgi:two-component system alkaline phosphatase synthesis response regulator PhoP|nr:MAG: DNA-binding response regulator [Firmicutes bacterium HGW-Firmicutes-14]